MFQMEAISTFYQHKQPAFTVYMQAWNLKQTMMCHFIEHVFFMKVRYMQSSVRLLKELLSWQQL